MTASGKRILVWLAIGLLLAITLILTLRPRAYRADLIEATLETMVVTVESEGKTRIHDVYQLSAPVAGRLQRIEVEVGDEVTAGQTVLARIEPGDPELLNPRSEAQAKAAIQVADSAFALARAELNKASAELEFADSERTRARALIVDGTISKRSFDEAERLYKNRRAALDTARAALQVKQFELDQARSSLISPIETSGSHPDCECVPITAPVSGRVLELNNQSERPVLPGQPIMDIGDPSDLEVVADFLSIDAVQIKVGQRVVIARWGGVEDLHGTVRSIEPFGTTKVSSLGIEEQRVNVLVSLDSDREAWKALGHGYQVTVRVVLWEEEQVLTIPLTSLFRMDGDWAVYRVENGHVNQRQVQIGKRTARVVQILEGLDVGDVVVTHPGNDIEVGIRIEPRLVN